MNPIRAHVIISAPREKVYELISDLSARPAWCGHYQRDYHLTRPRASGEGAGARFMVKTPFARTWVELVIVEANAPGLLREQLRLSRLGRTPGYAEYELVPVGRNTRVELMLWTEPATRVDAFKESIGGRRSLGRQVRKSLKRLRTILEEQGEKPLERAAIAGYEPAKAPRFGSTA
jgi:uncharacterized protein YndB with AHSA1/START domain